jgi:hypothetical protein
MMEQVTESHLLATAIGRMTVWADSLEEIKQSFEQRLGIPSTADLHWLNEWSNLDNMVCKMREMIREHDKILSDTQSEADFLDTSDHYPSTEGV